VRTRATRRPLRGFASGLFLSLWVAATDLAAAPNDAPGSTDWRLQMAERINQSKPFPAGSYCTEGVVRVTFLIDRAGKLLSSEVAESSNIPAFDVEALAILKRAQPFPPPPDGVGGAFVTIRVPVRFNLSPQAVEGEKRLHLNLKSDSSLTLDGIAVQSDGLDRAISTSTNSDKNARIFICRDQDVPPERVNDVAEQVKAAGFKFTVVPRPD
jgi:TonB family protein